MRPALRTTADGEPRTDVVAVITQQRDVLVDPSGPADGPTFVFRGGCTLLLDREYDTPPIRYAVCRPIFNDRRADRIRKFVHGPGPYGVDARYTNGAASKGEPFAAFHAMLQKG